MLGRSTATKLMHASRRQRLLLSHVPRLPCPRQRQAPHTKQQVVQVQHQQHLGAFQGE